jgi:ethanolamine utilization protein EutN
MQECETSRPPSPFAIRYSLFIIFQTSRMHSGGRLVLLGRVIGTVVNCVAYRGLAGVPMLIVQPLNTRQEASGEPIVCCDATRMAGRDELVYYEGGREAAMALEPSFVPVDHAIIGIVDGMDIAAPE